MRILPTSRPLRGPVRPRGSVPIRLPQQRPRSQVACPTRNQPERRWHDVRAPRLATQLAARAGPLRGGPVHRPKAGVALEELGCLGTAAAAIPRSLLRCGRPQPEPVGQWRECLRTPGSGGPRPLSPVERRHGLIGFKRKLARGAGLATDLPFPSLPSRARHRWKLGSRAFSTQSRVWALGIVM